MNRSNVLFVAMIALALAGCGGGIAQQDAPPPEVQKMLQGAPVKQGAPTRLGSGVVKSDEVVTIAGYRDQYTVSKDQSSGVVTVTNKSTNAVATYNNPALIKFFDKHTSFDLSGSAGQVYRLYQAAFNRQPDIGGLGFWIYVNQSGSSMLDIANGFINSDEFNSSYGKNVSNATFVGLLYNNVLHRAGEKGGLDWWTAGLDAGNSRPGVLTGFSESAENQNNLKAVLAAGFDYILYKPGSPIVPKFSSYENKVAASTAIGSQPLANIAGDATAFGDFFHDGTYSMVTNTLVYDNNNPLTSNKNGSMHFFQKVNGAWVDNTSALLKDTKGCLHPRKAIVADFNGDGKPDVFFACHGFDAPPYAGEQPHVLMSQDDGSYSNVTLDITCFCHAASAVDFKGDGHADIVLTDTGVLKQPFFLRNANGKFTVDTNSLPTSLKNQALFSAELIDFNGDGKYDLWIGGNEPGATQYAGGMPSEIILNDTQNGYLATKTYDLPINADYGLPLDIVFQNGKIYLLRTNIGGGPNNYGKSYYTTSVVQVIDYATMQSTIAYSHSGLYANGMQWVNWIIPVNGAVTAMNSNYQSNMLIK